MPQTSPMNWLILFFIINSVLMVVNIKMHYSSLDLRSSLNKNKSKDKYFEIKF